MRILIAEDDMLTAMDCASILRSAGHEVVGIAPNERSAFELAQRHKPDLALCDVRLVRGDGVKTAKKLRDYLGVPTIFVTAYGDKAVRDRAKSASPIDWIGKPYKPSQILNAVSAAKRSLDGCSPAAFLMA